jgi:hypothetical protein
MLRPFLAVLLVGVALSGETLAHNTQLSSSRLELTGRTAEAQVEMNGLDLQVALGAKLLGADGQVEPAAVDAAAGRIETYVAAHVELGASGVRCALTEVRLTPAAEHLRARLRFGCPPLSGTLQYRVTLFHEIDPRARHMVTVTGDAKRFGLLSVAAPVMELGRREASPWEVARHYLLAGVEHIAIGFDHIAFLIATVAWGRRFWPLAKIVTAFTVAHSITLSAAALDVFDPPGAWVEVLIAASIVYMAAENFFVRNVAHRWPIVFAFGLIHGFGFAGVLKDYGVPHEALVPALVSFNAGVEVGQLAIVGVVLAGLLAIDRAQRRAGIAEVPDRRVVHAISAVVLAFGLAWLGERLPEALAGA